MKKRYLFLFLLLALASCDQARMDQSMPKSMPQQAGQAVDQEESGEVTERKVIKEGTVEFETNDLEKTSAKIKEVVNNLKGYITREDMFEAGNRTSIHLTVKVPAPSFDNLVEQISEEAGTFDRKQISSEDVTEQFIDLESRLGTKKEIESRYIQLLSKAKTVEEILAIEKQIGILREEVESTEGRFRYLKNRIGFSTLEVHFYKKIDNTFLGQFGSAIVEGWHGITKFIIMLTYAWPFLILLGVGLFLYFRRRKNKTS